MSNIGSYCQFRGDRDEARVSLHGIIWDFRVSMATPLKGHDPRGREHGERKQTLFGGYNRRSSPYGGWDISIRGVQFATNFALLRAGDLEAGPLFR